MRHWIQALTVTGVRIPCTQCGSPGDHELVSEDDPKPGAFTDALGGSWTETTRTVKVCCFACARRLVTGLQVQSMGTGVN